MKDDNRWGWVEHECHQCKAKIKLKFHLDCPQDSLEKLIKAVVCDHCFQRKVLHEGALSHLNAAVALILSGVAPEKVRPRIVVGTKLYTRYVESRHGCRLIYNEEFADEILREPKKLSSILNAFQRVVGQRAREARQAQATPNLPYKDSML